MAQLLQGTKFIQGLRERGVRDAYLSITLNEKTWVQELLRHAMLHARACKCAASAPLHEARPGKLLGTVIRT